jgi:hypothetical protein
MTTTDLQRSLAEQKLLKGWLKNARSAQTQGHNLMGSWDWHARNADCPLERKLAEQKVRYYQEALPLVAESIAHWEELLTRAKGGERIFSALPDAPGRPTRTKADRIREWYQEQQADEVAPDRRGVGDS